MSSVWKSKMTTRPSHPTSHITITIPDNVCILTLNVRKAWALITVLIMGNISKRVWWLSISYSNQISMYHLYAWISGRIFVLLFILQISIWCQSLYVWISQKSFLIKSEMPFCYAALQSLKVKPLSFCFFLNYSCYLSRDYLY